MERRTDLALEARELAGENLQGVDYSVTKKDAIEIEKMVVKTLKASRMLKKPIGTYITIELPPLTNDFRDTDKRLVSIGDEIRSLLPVNGLVLVVGLGNTDITPDALGPKSASGVLATRHITGEIAKSTGLDKLRPVAVLNTGVTGQTGIETGEHILSVVKRIRPTALIVIDALASRRLERLGCTLQISNTGISPGAGVQNHRTQITEESMGVPVIAIGVPTVVDAVTLATDLLCVDDERDSIKLREKVSPKGRSMVVTPKEVDLLVDRAAKLISLAINFALQKDFEISDLIALL
ncbi:MAG: GPR endopeptidase [Ruminococcaceae bacterium]|nr:GPR endopeptidase [Oscillospiraceae bacterium]